MKSHLLPSSYSLLLYQGITAAPPAFEQCNSRLCHNAFLQPFHAGNRHRTRSDMTGYA